MKPIFCSLLLFAYSLNSNAQENEYNFDSLVDKYIKTEKAAIYIYSTAAIGNIGTSSIALAYSTDEYGKGFFYTSLGFGALQGISAYISANRVASWRSPRLTKRYALYDYSSTLSSYRVRIPVDITMLTAGTVLMASYTDAPDYWRGVFLCIVINGGVNLIIDGAFYLNHNSVSGKWPKLLKNIALADNGLGLKYVINYKDKVLLKPE